MTNLNPIKKKLSKVDRKISMQDPSKLLAEFFNGVVIELDEEYKYDSKELIDQVSANLFKQSGKLESRRSWLAMRNYLEQLDTEQLKSMLKDHG